MRSKNLVFVTHYFIWTVTSRTLASAFSSHIFEDLCTVLENWNSIKSTACRINVHLSSYTRLKGLLLIFSNTRQEIYWTVCMYVGDALSGMTLSVTRKKYNERMNRKASFCIVFLWMHSSVISTPSLLAFCADRILTPLWITCKQVCHNYKYFFFVWVYVDCV